MSKLNLLVVSLFIIVVVLGGYIMYLNKTTLQSSSTTQTTSPITPTSAPQPKGGFLYSKTGFTPTHLRFRSNTGIQIVFTNTSSNPLVLQSDSKLLNALSILPGETKTVSFSEIGAYTFQEKSTSSHKAGFEIIP
jgi:uncharacterized membrane protein